VSIVRLAKWIRPKKSAAEPHFHSGTDKAVSASGHRIETSSSLHAFAVS
jgi:hypothetical protein